MARNNAFHTALDALPIGSWRGDYKQTPYVVTKSLFSNGKSVKLVAEDLAGTDYISLNYYLLSSGETLLKPCEMPTEKVVQFVLGITPDQ